VLRILLVCLHDIAAAAAAWAAAHWLRFNMEITPYYLHFMWQSLLVVVPVQTLVFWKFGLYQGMWRYASIQDLKRLFAAVGVSALLAPLVLFVFGMWQPVPRTVLLLDPILLLAIMCGSRVAYRVWKEHDLYGSLRDLGKPVLILGAGDAALTLLRELQRSPDWRVVGFLDDDPAKTGRFLNGVKVFGSIDRLAEFAEASGAQHAVIAMPAATHEARRRAMQISTAAKVKALTVPSYEDLVSGKVKASALREVELDDLLGRDPVQLDSAGLHKLLAGRVVMVTGAGGSIGSELCRQIAAFEPRLLVMLELNEFALYTIEQEFDQRYPKLAKACVIADVKDAARVRQIMAAYAPGIVFHAAAYKHVPLMENDNAWTGLRNNVLGTYVVAQAAADCGASEFVLISTDKAVNPVNVMGATKRLAEIVIQALQRTTSTMSLVAVRFGNVLGSTGSVIPKFREQLARGGPITVTHPEIIRYFMSIPEAAQLVLQAGLMGKGGEVFLLDMGEPVRIVDLARDMIRLSGMSEEQVGIVFTGLRPGEKLYEELVGQDEQSSPTQHPKLRIVRAAPNDPAPLAELIAWLQTTLTLSDADTKTALARWVVEYRPAAAPAAPTAAASDSPAERTAPEILAAHARAPAFRS
jgi:FlaA1/EpsC-like NDP-sugar epimerase